MRHLAGKLHDEARRPQTDGRVDGHLVGQLGESLRAEAVLNLRGVFLAVADELGIREGVDSCVYFAGGIRPGRGVVGISSLELYGWSPNLNKNN